MRIHTSIDTENNRRTHVVESKISFTKLKKHLGRIFNYKDYQSGFNELWDLRNVVGNSITGNEINILVEFVSGKWKNKQKKRLLWFQRMCSMDYRVSLRRSGTVENLVK